MEIILNEGVQSLTGSLGRGFGYHIQRRKDRFYVKRNAKGIVPADGHWRFVLTCAEIAKMGLHIADVQIDALELHAALIKAAKHMAAQQVLTNYQKGVMLKYNARDIMNLKTTFGL